MSIVVTCACTQTYRLPNRYAGKRCKCRECGERIRVPVEAEVPQRKAKVKAKRKRKRAKQAVSRDTTRRLGAEAGTIIQEGQQLREGISRRRPISESIHQLSPLHSQSMLDDGAVTAPSRQQKPRKRRRSSSKARTGTAVVDEPKTKARKTKTKTKTKKSESKGREQTAPQEKTKTKGKAKVAKAPRTRPKTRGKATRGKAQTRAGRATAKLVRRGDQKRRPGRSSAAARRGRRDGEEETPRKGKSPTRHALIAVIAIVGVLCLGIGLIVGGVFTDGTVAKKSDADAKLTYLEQLTFKQQWSAAVTEADKLETEFATDNQAKARLFKMRRGIDAMAQIATVEDPEAKLQNLLKFVRDKSPAVRLGVSLGLRKMAESEEAQRALLALTKDDDKRVADASRMGMVHMGGRHSIPFLIEVIEQTAATGGKLGDLAVDQALQIQDAAVAPVLVKVLEVRKKASPAMLRQVLNRLSEIVSDAKQAEAAKPYTTHKDKRVQEAAKAVIAATE